MSKNKLNNKGYIEITSTMDPMEKLAKYNLK
jgi:hypothetical protein